MSPIRATVARLIKLDVCGVPVTGAASAVVVTDGWISIAYSPQYEDGTETIGRKVTGALCVSDLTPSEFKRLDLEMQWCVIDPDALVLQTGERLLTTGTPATGTGVAYGEGQLTSRYSLEVWQPIAGASACSATGETQYVYWAFPNVGNGRVGDFTQENGQFIYTISGSTNAASLLWGTGPGSDGPWIDDPIESGEHFLHNVTTVAPPTVPDNCGAFLLT